MICGVCRGSGSLLSSNLGLQWWQCPCCAGQGVSISGIIPATIVVKALNQAVKGKKKRAK